MTSSSCGRSRPALRAATITSAVAARLTPFRKLLSSFAVCPAPLVAHVVHVRAKCESAGRTRSSAAAEPPTMTVSVPASAALAPPEMPASRYSTPRSASRSWIASSRSGEDVLRSTTTWPLPAVGHEAVRAEDDRLDDGAVGQREEDDVHLCDESLDGLRGRRGRDQRHGVGIEVEPADALAGGGQAPSDPATHVPEPHDAELQAARPPLSSSRIGIPSAHAVRRAC